MWEAAFATDELMQTADRGREAVMMVIMMVMVMMVGMASPERPKVRNFMSFFRPVGSSTVSFSVSCVDPSSKKF